MNKILALFNRKISLLLALIFTAGIFAGCDMFNAPVKEYLEKYGDIASINGISFSSSSQVIGGTTYIPSGSDVDLYFDIDNPKDEELELSVRFDNSSLYDMNEIDSAKVVLNNSNNKVFSFTFKSSFLASIDSVTGSNDLSFSVWLYRKSDHQIQSKYTCALACDSAPPAITNALSQFANNLYVVCADIPALDSDVTYFAINGHEFDIASGTFTARTGNTWTMSTTSPGTLSATVSGGTSFTHSTGTAYYIVTDIADTDKSVSNFTMTLRDNAGLTSSLTIPARELKLVIENSLLLASQSTATINQDSDSDSAAVTFTVKDSDGNYVDASLYYDVTADSKAFASDTVTGSFTIKLPPVQNNVITVDATAPGYLAAEQMKITVNVNAKRLYVSSDGDDTNGFGTKEKPYELISTALNELSDPTDSGNTIYLMTDEVPDSVVSVSGHAEICGAKNGNIGSAVTISTDNLGSLSLLNTSGTTTLRNINVTGSGTVGSYDGLINVTSGSLTVTDCNVTGTETTGETSVAKVTGGNLYLTRSNITGNICKSGSTDPGQAIYINGGSLSFKTGASTVLNNLDGSGNKANIYLGERSGTTFNTITMYESTSKFGVETNNVPTVSSPVVITSLFSGSSPALYISSDKGYSVGLSGTEAAFVIGGGNVGGITHEQHTALKITSSSSPYTVNAGDSISFTITDESNIAISNSSVVFNFEQYGSVMASDTVTLTGTNAGTVTVPASLSAGTYIVEYEITATGMITTNGSFQLVVN